MQPLRGALHQVSILLISPDGALNLVPFAALRDADGQYLAQQYTVSYITSGRDLLRLATSTQSPTGGAPLIIAAPIFDGKAPLLKNQRRSVTTGANLSSVYFAPLAGALQEARSIAALFPGSLVLTGRQATKESLKQAAAPRILHIATHGFFLDDDASKPEAIAATGGGSGGAATRIENPLLRSGLALAGANLRSGGGRQDGILTALEASGLNLWGTKLVTLSACDTGLGEVKNGEGVYGFRRALALAGAETLVMSLWPVSDQVTRELMTAYYTGLQQGEGRGEALRQAQLRMIKRHDRQHPFYWASFIQSGEWKNLEGK
jgi:CHAT domain-containing protein